jgi:hypothetical protein
MHASIWIFRGDPEQLLHRYEAMVRELPPANMKLHLCLRAPDGIVVVDTCPTKEAFDAFVGSPHVRTLRERHGLPDPERIDDFPVHLAIVAGERAA